MGLVRKMASNVFNSPALSYELVARCSVSSPRYQFIFKVVC